MSFPSSLNVKTQEEEEKLPLFFGRNIDNTGICYLCNKPVSCDIQAMRKHERSSVKHFNLSQNSQKVKEAEERMMKNKETPLNTNVKYIFKEDLVN